MAQFTFTNNTYAGSALAGFMASTLLESDTIKRGLITVITDVKARKIILDADDSVVFQNPSGIFNDQGTTAQQTESYLDPVVYEFMKQEQWDKLIQSWEVASIAPGSFNDYEGVVDLSDFMINRYLSKIQIANEQLFWLGKAANPGTFSFSAAYPGLVNQIATNSGTYKVSLFGNNASKDTASAISASGVMTVADTTKYQDGDVLTVNVQTGSIAETTSGSPVALLNNPQSYIIHVLSATTLQLQRNYNNIGDRKNATFTGTATAANISYINASNVLAVLGWVYSQVDYADALQDDFRIMMPLHVSRAYAQAQANKITNIAGAYTDKKMMDYLGDRLELMSYFPGNTIIAARTSNLFLGVDLLSDEQELSTVYLKPYTNDNVVRMKARMKSCTTVKFYNEVFYLGA